MGLLDVARGAYARAPRIVRRSLAPLVSLVPAKAKFGTTYEDWRARIAASADPAIAHAAHLAALRALLVKAHAASPFYRDLMERHLGAGFDLANALPDDLRRLPILRKADLAAAGDAALTVPRTSLDRAETSGSNSERPFSFYLDRDRSPREMAFVMACWARVGFTETDSKIVLRGVGVDGRGRVSSEWEPALRELRLSVFPLTRSDVARYADLIDRHGVRYLYGYPSAIDLMARHMIALGRRLQQPLKGVLPISEPLHAHQRAAIREAFGNVPISSFYGLSEKVLFATEDMVTPGLHVFQPLYGLAELVDDNDAPVTEPGQEGRLVGTGFLSTGMPFIRYDTHDRAALVELPTEANGQRLRVADIVPRRKPGYLVAADGGRIVSTDLTPERPGFYKGVEEFQFFQEQPGKVVMRYIPAEGGSERDAIKIVRDLEDRVRHRLAFSVERVDTLAGGRGGKRAFIDQRLDLGQP